ncbi:MAG TPA: hypothetical protein VM657_08625 [Sphingomonas sp.]|nr:hypothetical protein [Sphingomonas sp.]
MRAIVAPFRIVAQAIVRGNAKDTSDSVSRLPSGRCGTGRERADDLRTPSPGGARAIGNRHDQSDTGAVSIAIVTLAAEAGTASCLLACRRPAPVTDLRYPRLSGSGWSMPPTSIVRLPFGAGRLSEVRRRGGVDSDVGPSFRVGEWRGAR